jgi:hypothetical protein
LYIEISEKSKDYQHLVPSLLTLLGEKDRGLRFQAMALIKTLKEKSVEDEEVWSQESFRGVKMIEKGVMEKYLDWLTKSEVEVEVDEGYVRVMHEEKVGIKSR